MARETNAHVTQDDLIYMRDNEGFTAKQSIPTGNECMTRQAIENYLEIEPDPVQGYAMNQLVCYQDIQVPQIDTTTINWIIGGGKVSGYNYNIATSNNGTEWTLRNISNLNSVSEVKYLGGKWIAYGSAVDTQNGAISDDGITWTAMNIPFGGGATGLTYGEGKYVATHIASDYTPKFAYSTDGINWTVTSKTWTFEPFDVVYGDGKFIACGESSSGHPKIVTSLDGVNWTNTDAGPGMSYGEFINYNGSQWLVGGSDDLFYSSDGVSWTRADISAFADNSSGELEYVDEIRWFNGMWVVAIQQGTEGHEIITSPDAVTWTGRGSNFSGTANGLGNNQDHKIIALFGTSSLYSSSNGTSWVYTIELNSQITASTISCKPYTPDDIPPTFSTDLTSPNKTNDYVDLSWVSTDNIGVTEQILYWRVSGGTWQTITLSASATSHTKSGLSGDTTYEFYIKAKDAELNEANSYLLTVTTNADPITTYSELLGTSTSSSGGACDDFNTGYYGTYYLDTSGFLDATKIWTDSSATNYAGAGYYSDGGSWRYWSGSAFTGDGVCSIKP